MERLKVISVVGARPNFIKIAPLCREFKKVGDKIGHLLIHTGQHYDFAMSDDFFESLAIPKPDMNLEVGSGSHAFQTANIMLKFESVCIDEKPDWVIVVGDVNSTLAGAIVAKKLQINLAHIEAGLRSFDMTMPEEVNRKVTDCIADVLFTPSLDADMNLIQEGIAQEKIVRVGNIMIDTLINEFEEVNRRGFYEKFGLKEKDFIYVTLHRPDNVDYPDMFSSILTTLIEAAKKWPIIFPLHLRSLRRFESFGLNKRMSSIPNLVITDPISYHDSISLAKNALLVITDSGGLQEETTFLGTPCLTLRPNTERPITISEGTNKLTSQNKLLKDIEESIENSKDIHLKNPPPLWDGKTAQRIVEFFLSKIPHQ